MLATLILTAAVTGQMIRLDGDPKKPKEPPPAAKKESPKPVPKTKTITVFEPDPDYVPKLGEVAWVFDRNGNHVFGARTFYDADKLASFLRSGDRVGIAKLVADKDVVGLASGSRVLVNELADMPHGSDPVRQQLGQFAQVRVLEGPNAGAQVVVFRLGLTRPRPRQVEVPARRRR